MLIVQFCRFSVNVGKIFLTSQLSDSELSTAGRFSKEVKGSRPVCLRVDVARSSSFMKEDVEVDGFSSDTHAQKLQCFWLSRSNN